MLRHVFLMLTFSSITFLAPAQNVPKRIALVIGNTNYEWKTPLDNAVPDAEKIAKQLRQLGFDVDGYYDLDYESLSKALIDFGTKIKDKGPNVVTFFYYSGHAAQDVAQINYLIPINADATSPDNLREQATPLQTLLRDMVVANNAVNIIVLDACRDWYPRDTSVSVRRGLHDVGREGNMLIAMATSPNKTADDSGNEGSPFSRRLLEGLTKDYARSLTEMLDDVQGKVYSDTSGRQAPEFINGLARSPRWSLALSTVNVNEGIRLIPRRIDIKELPPFLLSLNRDRLSVFTQGRTSIVDTLLQRRDLLAEAGITTPQRLAYFLGTVSHETANFRLRTEIFTRSDNVDVEEVANRLYAGRLGNGDKASGDGWRYRGRGYFMIAGKRNYKLLGDMIGVDLLAAPDLVLDPEVNLAVALNIWSRYRVNSAVDADDIVTFRRKFPGGTAGMHQLAIEIRRAKEILDVPVR